MFIVYDGQLTRLGSQPGFEQYRLIDAVRAIDRETLHEAMDFVLGKSYTSTSFAPWAAQRI